MEPSFLFEEFKYERQKRYRIIVGMDQVSFFFQDKGDMGIFIGSRK